MQHLQLAIRLEAWQYAAGMVVVKKLATQFKIKLVAKLTYPFTDVFTLDLEIFLVVESYFHKLFVCLKKRLDFRFLHVSESVFMHYLSILHQK